LLELLPGRQCADQGLLDQVLGISLVAGKTKRCRAQLAQVRQGLTFEGGPAGKTAAHVATI
jgi:hypothetical protein